MTERVARPELVTRCKGAKGWRRDAFANWWPCSAQDEMEQGEEQDRAAD